MCEKRLILIFTFHYASTLSVHKSSQKYPVCNLHSTMLLLYRLLRLRIKFPSFYLHSTMLLLYLDDYYMPQMANIFTFHYASTLSRRLLVFKLMRQIYIPLCFYFIVWLYCPRWYMEEIYIPLCFYFIAEYFVDNISGYIFTFHYASTLSTDTGCSAGSETQFTFHYASTLSLPDELKQAILCNLHSTMLLLYQNIMQLKAL